MQLVHFNYSIEILKGTICSEFTTHGGVLLSGLKLLQRIITSKVEVRPQNYALICQRCIRECSIVKHMLQSITRATNTTGKGRNIPMMIVTPQPRWQIQHQDVFLMSPAVTTLIDAFFTVCQSLQWHRVGVVTSSNSHLARDIYNYLKSTSRKKHINFFINRSVWIVYERNY